MMKYMKQMSGKYQKYKLIKVHVEYIFADTKMLKQFNK